jgi:hypothetical protein
VCALQRVQRRPQPESHTAKVDRKNPVAELRVEPAGPDVGHAGVQHERMQRAEPLDRGHHHRVVTGFGADVADHRRGAVVAVDPRQAFAVEIDRDDGVPLREQELGGRLPDSRHR